MVGASSKVKKYSMKNDVVVDLEILHEMKFRLTSHLVSLALNCIFLDFGLFNTLFRELISKGKIGNQTQSIVALFALIFHKIKSLSNPDVSARSSKIEFDGLQLLTIYNV